MQQEKEKRYNSGESIKKRNAEFMTFCKWYAENAIEISEDEDDYGNDDAECNFLNCC